MNFIDKEDIPFLEAGEDGGQITRFFDHRPRGAFDADAHLAGDDVGQGGLAQSRRAMEQHVVESFLAVAGGLDEDGEILPRLALADVLAQKTRPQAGLVAILAVGELG